MKLLKSLPLFAIVIVPIENKDNFLDLKYKKLPPNKVELNKEIKITVKNTASPLFYKVDPPKKFSKAEISGLVQIKKKLESEEKDSYFQLGVVYEGDYRPGGFIRTFLPEWLLKILDINDKYGVGNIDFNHFTGNSTEMDKEDSVRDIKMKFKTVGKLNEKGEFNTSIKLRDKKILGLWLRADGDDHKGEFETTIKTLKLN